MRVEYEAIANAGFILQVDDAWLPALWDRIGIEMGAAAQYANQLADVYGKLADYLADGRKALVINHGGVLELGAVACLPNADHLAWGSHFEYCEGIRLFWDDGKFVEGEVLRVSK
jgi:hypothetical protein